MSLLATNKYLRHLALGVVVAGGLATLGGSTAPAQAHDYRGPWSYQGSYHGRDYRHYGDYRYDHRRHDRRHHVSPVLRALFGLGYYR